MIRNCPLNSEDSVRAYHIYRPARTLIQRSMKCHINTAERVSRVPLPTDISLHHKNIGLYSDFFNMNGMPFLNTNPSKITFLTAEKIISNSTDNIIK